MNRTRTQRLMLLGVGLLALSGLALGRPDAAPAATLSVCPSGCPYSTIGAAIAAAQPGDTISVGAGTYLEHFTIGIPLTISGADEQHTIVTNGGGYQGAGISVAASPVGMTNLTVTGWSGSPLTTAAGATLSLDHITVSNSGSPGVINAGTLTASNCTVSGNTTSGMAGGIWSQSGSTLRLANCTVSGNYGGKGGAGGILAANATVALDSSTVTRNTGTQGYGGGLELIGGTATVTNSAITNNHASDGGGILSTGGASVTLQNTLVQGNSTPQCEPQSLCPVHLLVTVPTTATLGTAFAFRVTAQDANNSTVTSYSGTVHFTSSDAQAVLPADYTFTAADAGTHIFSVTLNTAGSQTLTATDTANSNFSGTSNSIGVSAAAPTYRAIVLADSPLAYWRLDETSGTTAADQTGPHPGSYLGNPTLGVPGALIADPDPAVQFDGRTQDVSVPYAPALNTKSFTVEAWAYPTGGDWTWRGVAASRYYPQGWVLYAGSDNHWQFWLNSPGGGMTALVGTTVADNTWTHLVGTYDGSTARLYVDGTLVASASVSGYTPQGTDALAIGQSEPGAGFYFPGRIDEPALYGAALTASQVQRHYHFGIATRYASTVLGDRPTAYWRLDEASGSTAADQQGAYPGSYLNNPVLGQQGALAADPDTAVSFGGSNPYVSYVDVPYTAALNTTSFTVEAWAYPTGGDWTWRGVAASRYYPQGWVLYAGADNHWQFWLNNGAGGMTALVGGSVTPNVWTYLVGTYDGSTAGLYINGTLVASAPVAGYTPQTTKDLAIGQSEPGAGFAFPGRIDEPAAYPGALTPAQVQAHYQIGTWW